MIARLDLSNLLDMVKVLSGNVDSVQECEELRAKVGDDPRVWVPLFCNWKQSSREAAHAA